MRLPVAMILAMTGVACLDVPGRPLSGDGGPDIDAAGPDTPGRDGRARPDGARSPLCDGQEGYLFCDDFEDGLSRWDDSLGGTDVEDAELVVRSNGGEPTHVLKELEPYREGKRYLRGDFEFDDGLEVLAGTTIFGLFDKLDASSGFGVAVNGSGELAILQPGGELAALGPVPAGDWYCIELEASIDDDEITLKLTADGEERTVTAASPTVGLEELRIGMLLPGPEGPARYEVDDVAVATNGDDCDGPP